MLLSQQSMRQELASAVLLELYCVPLGGSGSASSGFRKSLKLWLSGVGELVYGRSGVVACGPLFDVT